jgi:hypothetical protein
MVLLDSKLQNLTGHLLIANVKIIQPKFIYIEDGDYVKISNVTLGYDFKKLFTNLPLQQVRFYVSAQNLYTFTNYSGMDPEVGYGYDGGSGNQGNWSSGIDLGFYPAPRTYLVGLNLKF